MNRERWIDLFVMRMSWHGIQAEPEQINELAEERYELWGDVDPVVVADAEIAELPPG